MKRTAVVAGTTLSLIVMSLFISPLQAATLLSCTGKIMVEDATYVGILDQFKGQFSVSPEKVEMVQTLGSSFSRTYLRSDAVHERRRVSYVAENGDTLIIKNGTQLEVYSRRKEPPPNRTTHRKIISFCRPGDAGAVSKVKPDKTP